MRTRISKRAVTDRTERVVSYQNRIRGFANSDKYKPTFNNKNGTIPSDERDSTIFLFSEIKSKRYICRVGFQLFFFSKLFVGRKYFQHS